MTLRFAIGAYVADEASDTLAGKQGIVKLERRTMATLVHLASRPNTVVSREELLATIWPKVLVSDHSVATVISDLRKAFEDDPRAPRYIETISKRGYRLIALVERLDPGSRPSNPERAGPLRAPVTHPAVLGAFLVVLLSAGSWIFSNQLGRAASAGTIAIYDFQNGSGSSELDHIPYALTDAVSSTVASASSSPVIRLPLDARRDRGRARDIAAAVSGRVIRDGDNILAHLEVSDPESGEILWAEDYPVAPGRLSSRSREMARDVAAALGLTAPEMLQAASGTPEGQERYWRARFLWERRDLGSVRAAREILVQLTRDEPGFAAAHAALADIYAHKSGDELGIPRTNTFDEAQRLLHRANRLAPSTSDTLVTQSILAFYRDSDLGSARRAAEQAIDRNPDNARAWQTLAMVESGAGNRDASIRAINRAARIAVGSGAVAWDQAWHLYLARRYPEALAAADRVRQLGQSSSLIVALVHDAEGRDQAALKAWLARAAEAGVPQAELDAITRGADRASRYKLLANAFRRASKPPRPVIVAHLLVQAADVQQARRELAASKASRGDWMLVWAPHMPDLGPLIRKNRQAVS